MENVILLALVATIGTWFITAMGAATVVFFKEGSPKAMNLMLGFSAGVMIAASFWSLLSPAIERAEMYLSVPPWRQSDLRLAADLCFCVTRRFEK